MLRLNSRTLWGAAIFWLVLLAAGVWFRQELQEWFRPALPASASDRPASVQDAADHATSGHEHMPAAGVEGEATFYTCSMHPSVKSEAPGTCPICSMDLTPISAVPGADDEVAYHTCSMHPSVKSEPPGTCPICSMDLVPVSAEQAGSGIVQIDARRRQLIGVTTSEVVTASLTSTIHAVGIVRYDETALVEVSPRVHGWIGEVFIDFTGKPVRKGEPLFTLYSPELLSAQGDYLEALRLDREAAEMKRVGRDHALVAAARRRLSLWELTEEQIQSLHQDGQSHEYVTFSAPASGIVMSKSITEGSPVQPGQVLYRITPVDPVWIEAELHEADLSLVREGMLVRVALSYLPEEEFSGVVAYVYPYLTDTTRTGRIRVEIPNPRGALKPDMYAEVELEIPLGAGILAPEGAVIFAGKRRFVFVDLGEGFLAPREVVLGARVAEGYQILDGLSAGEVVVSSGNFLVAADAQLRAAMETW